MASAPPTDKASKEEDEEGQDSCPICLEVLKEPIVTLPCSHKYCSECLEGWRSKYSSASDRTCPTCRKTIPATREMVMQYRSFMLSYNSSLQSYHNRPYQIPTIPGDPDHDPYKECFRAMPTELRLQIRAMPPDLQQETLHAIYANSVRRFQEDIESMRERYGDSLDSPLEDPGANRVEELPWEITDAAAQNKVEQVIRWLGTRPIPPERINAKNPEKMDRTLLAEAVYEQHVGLMCYLLQEGAEVDPLNCFGTTPLRQACSMALEKAIRVLLEWGADKDLREPSTPELHVMRCGNRSLARLLASPLGGRRCEIVGLKSRVDLNGKTCILNRYLPDTDRYEVQVEHSDEEVSVKSSNLKRRDRTPLDCGVFYAFVGTSRMGHPMWDVGRFLTQAEVKDMEREE